MRSAFCWLNKLQDLQIFDIEKSLLTIPFTKTQAKGPFKN
jgi:hypothetical protein